MNEEDAVLNRLHPRHPENLAAARENARSLLINLVHLYGDIEARLIWQEAAKAIPAKRGRPIGARSREDGFNARQALDCLYAFAHFEPNANLTRWQVIRMAAEHIVDWGGRGAIPKDQTTSSKRQDLSENGAKLVQSQKRKVKVEAMHKRLEREQKLVDQYRATYIARYEKFYGDGPESVASFMSAKDRAQKLAEALGDLDLLHPGMPQTAESAPSRRTRKPDI